MSRGNIFSQVEMRRPKHNTFDLSHDKKMSLNMGELIPTLVMEVIPADRIRGSQQQLVRFAPMLAPVMHQVNIYTHYFFVPNRLVFKGWEDFITGGEDGLDQTLWPFMQVGSGQLVGGSIFDYMGLPNNIGGNTVNVSCLPFAAYNMIYNEYYRDQNLQPVRAEDQLQAGINTLFRNELTIHRRAWQHDYFTAALPWTQKGPEATIPLGVEAPIIWDWQNLGGNGDQLYNDFTGNPSTDGNVEAAGGSGNLSVNGASAVSLDNSRNLKADLTGASAATINDLRRSFRLQEWLEKNARGGSRYTESIYIHFGVKNPDSRLQRPEYLGGGRNPVQFSEVLNTTGIESDPGGIQALPQGNMAGHGISAGGNGTFNYYAQEHGYIIGITSIMPRATYQQGIPKHFLKSDKFDYYWRQFAHLGEQAIENKEIYNDPTNQEENDATFGYIPRYAEYKYMNNTAHADMRDSLDFWHLGRKFSNRPHLNSDFIECVPSDRIFAVDDTGETDKIWCHIYNKITAKRIMPVFGTPTI